jgi:hypothetical protein
MWSYFNTLYRMIYTSITDVQVKTIYTRWGFVSVVPIGVQVVTFNYKIKVFWVLDFPLHLGGSRLRLHRTICLKAHVGFDRVTLVQEERVSRNLNKLDTAFVCWYFNTLHQIVVIGILCSLRAFLDVQVVTIYKRRGFICVVPICIQIVTWNNKIKELWVFYLPLHLGGFRLRLYRAICLKAHVCFDRVTLI